MTKTTATSKISRASVLLERVLLIAQNANHFAPGIGIAAAAAVQLVRAIQIAEKNEEDFIGLGESCTLILEALSKVEPGDDAERTRLQEDTEQFEAVVQSIAKIVRKRGKKSPLWKRLWNHLDHERIIEQCQKRIEDALKLFNLQGIIELRQQVARLHGTSAPRSGEAQQPNGGQHSMGIDNEGGIMGACAAPGGELSAGGDVEVTRTPLSAIMQEQTPQPSPPERPLGHVGRPATQPATEPPRPNPRQYTSDPETYTWGDTGLNNRGGIMGACAAGGGKVSIGGGIAVTVHDIAGPKPTTSPQF